MIEEPPLLTIRRPSRRPTDAQIAAFQGVRVDAEDPGNIPEKVELFK